MEAKRMYQEPKMKVVNIDPTAMICQSEINPGGNQPDDPEEGVKLLESALEDIW